MVVAISHAPEALFELVEPAALLMDRFRANWVQIGLAGAAG
jgi:hypothetical protein